MKTRSYEFVDQEIERATPVIQRIAREVWQLAELSLQEVQSAQLLMPILQENGFTIVSKGTAGVPTAFIAEYGSGAPILGYLVEYDALPGLGNEPVPRREPRKDHVSSGHGCGHNLLGAGSTGAAIALKNVMIAQNLPGTIRVYGCAAEETEGAKFYMARAGLFRDLDAALHWHPGPTAEASNYRTAAIDQLRIEFFGKAAHAVGVSVHTWAATASHGTDIGLKGAIQTARVLARTGLDLMTDAELRQAARADFEQRVKERPYTSPLSPEMKHPLEIPEWVTETVLTV